MHKERKTIPLLLAMALCAAANAHAEAPTSQFGFSGWPYRQPTTCQTEQWKPQQNCTPAPVITEQPVITQVPQPPPIPSEKPVITQVPQPTQIPDDSPVITQVPTATIEATATPTPTKTPAASIQPTAVPTPAATPVATPRPTASATPTPTATPHVTQTPEVTKKPVIATPTPSTDEDYTTGYVGVQEENAFLLLNQDRAANGLPALQLDPALCSIARMKSNDMKTNNYFSHTSPTYGSPSQMLSSMGYPFRSVGENIAHHATVEKAQAAFMSSTGHRKNILSSSWTKVGIGVVYDAQGFVYVTQLFVR